MSDNILLKKGLSTADKPEVENGSVLFETDSGRMYIDDNDTRTQIGRKISHGDALPEDGIDGDVFLLSGDGNSDAEMFDTLYPVVNEHVNNVDNPHNVTWEQVGAAPAGYGLGEMVGKDVSGADFNTITENGWYSFGGGGPNMPTSDLGYSHMFVAARNSDNLTQFVFQSNVEVSKGTIIKRTKWNGVWGEWEWVNPPMNSSVEYRTTERLNGKPIYKKLILISTDTFNDYAASYNIPHGISNADIFLTPEVFWQDGGSLYWRNFPGAYYGDIAWCTQMIVDTTYMFFEIGQSAWPAIKASKKPVFVILKYTKNEV